jgi:hypothetical protein
MGDETRWTFDDFNRFSREFDWFSGLVVLQVRRRRLRQHLFTKSVISNLGPILSATISKSWRRGSAEEVLITQMMLSRV